MKKNKKLLLFLALNSLATSYASENSQMGTKYDKLYNNMVKNIEKGKSNEQNYKLIQDVLDKRNQELKDLYMQGDYIVKPEYLEWQVFFSGFYSENNRGDNTMSNAKYYSNPQKSNGDTTLHSSQTSLYGGDLITGHFKPYRQKEEGRFIELGVSLNIKGMEKSITDIKMDNIDMPLITLNEVSNTVNPLLLDINPIELDKFNINKPNITTLNFKGVPQISIKGGGGTNAGRTGFFPYGDPDYTSLISQMDLISGHITSVTSGGIPRTMYPGYSSYTLDNVIGNPSPGLSYNQRTVYNAATGTSVTETALLPVGIYSDSLLSPNKNNIVDVRSLMKVIHNPITRYGVSGSNSDDLTISLEGNVKTPVYLATILEFDEHYQGLLNTTTGKYEVFTLDNLETKGWITSAEKTEFGSKFLDATLGHTTSNRPFQYVENNGSFYLKGADIVAVNIQAHGGMDDANSIFMNRGKIIGLNEASSTNNLLGRQVAFMFTEGATILKHEGFDNTGNIEMRAPQSIIYYIAPNAYSKELSHISKSGSPDQITLGIGKQILMNNGDMKLYGNNNIGIYTHNGYTDFIWDKEEYYLDGTYFKGHVESNLSRSEIKLYKPITVLGDDSIGVDIERILNFNDSKIKINVGTEDPKQTAISVTGNGGLENSGNSIGKNSSYTEGSTGVYVDMTGNIVLKSIISYDCRSGTCVANYPNVYSIGNPEFTINDLLLNVGPYSRGGAGLRVENYGDVVLGVSTNSDTSHEINLLAGGENNAAIYISGANAKVTNNGLIINVDGKTQIGAQIESDAKFYHNSGTITINGKENTGIAVKATGLGEINNTAELNVSANNLGVYNDGIFNMTNGKIMVNGDSAAGVYSAPSNTTTSLAGGTIRAENGAIALYSDKNSVTNLGQGLNLESSSKGILFYNYNTAGSGRYNLTGAVNATVESGGNAFYIGGGQTLNQYLTSSFTGSGNLDLTMQSNSRLYMLEGSGLVLSLTGIENMVAPGTLLTPNVSINSASASDYIPLSMDKGTLVLDRNVNLDSTQDMYKRSEFTSISVDVNSGTIMSGTQNNQIGIAQKNYAGTSGINEIKLNNMGEINLSGNNVVGIASDYGHIININKISVTGNNSIGIVSANGTQIENNGEIVIGGTDTAGIYGVHYLDGVTPASVLGYGDDGINISNNGKITSVSSGRTYGVYADNKIGATSSISLGADSNIDLIASNGGVGVHANNTSVTGGGIITVGTNGLGMYAKDSNVNLTGITMNLKGDNALGFYLDGTTNFAGTGNVNVDGQNIAIFNVNSSGTFSNSFNITSTVGSSYSVIGNVNNGMFYYNGTASLGANGSLVNGTNTAVLFDTASNITGTGSSVVAAALNGQYTGITPSGFTIGIDGENRGTIALGDSSAGLYGTNGARLLNKSNIAVGNTSLGLYSTGIGSTLRNEGVIEIGQKSEGMYGSESSEIVNTGNILSASLSAVGIYGEGSQGMIINNIGTMSLQGTDSRGIYTKGTGIKTITNSGDIKIGDSLNSTQPGVGIYSENTGDTITNIGVIETGASSVGIYSKSGIVTQNGQINAGVNGTGIYADGSTVNLNIGSSLSVGNDNGVGVYALNGSNVVNNGVTTIGNGSYGYTLKSGSNLLNNEASILGDSAVLVYGTEAGNIVNNGQITMTGSNNVGIYTENGGAILNSADILGALGQANMGIYNDRGSINNTGNISVGDSIIIDPDDSTKNNYAVGIYGDRTAIENHGDITIGANGIGIFTKDSPTATKNYGNISSNSDGAIGIFAENSKVENYGDITLGGKSSIGIYGNKASEIKNHGMITLNNDDSSGIMLNMRSTLDNQGIINVNGNNSNAVVLEGGSRIVNTGTMNIAGGIIGSSTISYGGSAYKIPSIVNAGVIRVSENFETKGMDILVKVDPSTITAPTTSDLGAAFVSDAVKFYAPSFNVTNPIGVLSGFTTGTHAEVYKFEDVFNPSMGNSETITVKSKSLTWLATPVLNANGNVDIWMEKIPYDEFTNGLWYEDFGKALDGKYVGSTGDAGKIFDKIDSIEEESDFRHTMASLSGNVYANMNQREETIAGVLGTSLNLLQDSSNNTKENVKVNIIAGKGTLSEDTDGVVGYDYETTGVLALREVERTYKHTFGYSLGYLHTNFAFKDGNNSEEDADTIQLGAHSKYRSNDWILRNDLTGRVSIHNIDRNLDWSNSGRSEMNGKYEAYSITSDNNLGRELSLGKNATVIPYGGLEATYMTRPTFTESGLESLEVKGNDAWSVKPKVGIELKASTNESKNGWKLKGALDVSYGYELVDLNEREYAKLTAVESDYHKLSKPEENKGVLKTKAVVGAEIEDRYGIFLTGEYSVGEHNQDDYRAGVTLKAVF